MMKKGISHKLWIGLLLLAVAIYLLLPVFARLGLEHWLHTQGYEQVHIDKLELEPFAGELRITGLEAKQPDGPALVLGEGYLNIAWLDLGHRQGHLQGLAISGLDLALVQGPDGQLILSGLPLPQRKPDQADKPSPWGFGIDRLSVRDSELVLRLPGVHQTLKLTELKLLGMHSWDADNPARLTADARLGDAQVRIDGELTPFADTPGGQMRLRINGADLAHLTGDLQDRLPPDLKGVAGKVAADLQLNGQLKDGVPQLHQQGSIRLRELAVTLKDARHRIARLDWTGKLTWIGKDGLSGNGSLDASDLSAQLDGQPQTLAKASWQGRFGWSRRDGVSANGALDATELSTRLGGQAQGIAALHWQGKLDWTQQAGLTAQGDLDATRLSAQLSGQPQGIASARWQGRLSWSAETGAGSDGQLTLKDTTAQLDGRQLALSQLDWQGKAGWSKAAGPTADGKLHLTTLEAAQPAQGLMLAQLSTVDMTSVRLGRQGDGDVPPTLVLDGITATDPVLLQPTDQASAKPLLKASALQLGKSELHLGRHLALGTLQLDAAQLTIVRQANGKLALLDRLAAKADQVTPQTATPAAAPKSADEPLRISLTGVQLGKDSLIDFTDLSVEPRFHQKLDIDHLALGAMDSATPKDWTPIELKGQLGEYSRLALAGKVQPFAKQLNLQLDGTLKSINLPPLSSYTTKALGYAVQSGQLDSEISIKITNDVLDGEAQLVLNQLTVKAADAKRLARLTHELSMPLDAALNMLRDGDNNIRLTLPVSGDINKPSFDLSDIINTAMGNALKKAALSYIKYALQPYGALITIAEYAGKAANRLALKSVPFPAGAAEPDADELGYLEKVEGLLNQRPKLNIRICGIATTADRQALAQQVGTQGKPVEVTDDTLLALANARAGDIKRRLVERGITPERLFLCNPTVDSAADAQPRVDLEI